MNKVIQVLRNYKLKYLAQFSSIFVFQKAKNQKHNLVPILSKNAQNTTLLKFSKFLIFETKEFFVCTQNTDLKTRISLLCQTRHYLFCKHPVLN